MSINWFPGHMHKARKEIAEVMPQVDIIIELLAWLLISGDNRFQVCQEFDHKQCSIFVFYVSDNIFSSLWKQKKNGLSRC